MFDVWINLLLNPYPAKFLGKIDLDDLEFIILLQVWRWIHHDWIFPWLFCCHFYPHEGNWSGETENSNVKFNPAWSKYQLFSIK